MFCFLLFVCLVLFARHVLFACHCVSVCMCVCMHVCLYAFARVCTCINIWAHSVCSQLADVKDVDPEDEEEDGEEEEETEEQKAQRLAARRYLRRLDKGLFTLQQVCMRWREREREGERECLQHPDTSAVLIRASSACSRCVREGSRSRG